MMKNPLSKYFPTEERIDGIYIKVTPQGLYGFDFDQCIIGLDAAMVTNYDPIKIKDVISR